MNNTLFSRSVKSIFFLAFPLMGACSWAGQMAKDSVDGVASKYGSEHFTLIAIIPPNFGFTSKAQYSPKDGESCQVYSPGLGGSVTRQQQKSNKTPAKSTEQTISTEIPLEYQIAGCSMALTRVDYEVNATYGTDAWDHDLEHAGGLAIVDNELNTVESSEQRGLCTWLFQISTAKAKKGEIEKILSCNSADENWQVPESKPARRKPGGVAERSKLPGRTIKLILRQATTERPSIDDTWQKLPEGWKPCLGRGVDDPYGFCRGNTKDFRTFKLNGRECTVYPNCN
ncbi:hypothetical protein [Pseudomonas arsenicoxydans]|uniref:Lipoprotein n=1 Tax=Pseudomonas arsenicoxydans TaxID=702115 RepID=A0A4P6G4E6_9PSED|nr:hypothetical protein [Pseudomonas arsenicoxydans]QAY86339.1 hypothetical protein CUN61_21330 [Pseudomonas arsenicoxydans]